MVYKVIFRGKVVIEYHPDTGHVVFKEQIASCRFIRGDAGVLAKWLLKCQGDCGEDLILN